MRVIIAKNEMKTARSDASSGERNEYYKELCDIRNLFHRSPKKHGDEKHAEKCE
jgi:hypothetical protein